MSVANFDELKLCAYFFLARLDMDVGFACTVTHKLMVHHKNMRKRDTFPNDTLLILREKYAYFYSIKEASSRKDWEAVSSLKTINLKSKIILSQVT